MKHWYFLAFFLLSLPSQAQQVHIQSSTVADLYAHLRANRTAIQRYRVHQGFGVSAYDLLGDGSRSLSLVTSLRFDTDFGLDDAERSRTLGAEAYDLALMYAYLEARGLGGWLDLRLGRQYEVDALDMTLYDGLRLSLVTPWYFAVDALIGLEARNELGPLTESPQGLDGTWDRRLLLDGTYGAPEHRLVYGFGLHLVDLPYTQFQASFREIRSFDQERVHQRRVGATFAQRVVDELHLKAGFSYDLFATQLAHIDAGLRTRPVELFEAELNYRFQRPTFDADSIFNVFSTHPYHRVEERVRFHVDPNLHLYGGSTQTIWFAAPEGVAGVEATMLTIGALVGGRWRLEDRGHMDIDFRYERGYGGEQAWLALGGGTTFLDQTLGLDARGVLAIFDDAQQPLLEGSMFGVEIETWWKFENLGKLKLLVEESSSGQQPSWTRVLLALDVDAWL